MFGAACTSTLLRLKSAAIFIRFFRQSSEANSAKPPSLGASSTKRSRGGWQSAATWHRSPIARPPAATKPRQKCFRLWSEPTPFSRRWNAVQLRPSSHWLRSLPRWNMSMWYSASRVPSPAAAFFHVAQLSSLEHLRSFASYDKRAMMLTARAWNNLVRSLSLARNEKAILVVVPLERIARAGVSTVVHDDTLSPLFASLFPASSPDCVSFSISCRSEAIGRSCGCCVIRKRSQVAFPPSPSPAQYSISNWSKFGRNKTMRCSTIQVQKHTQKFITKNKTSSRTFLSLPILVLFCLHPLQPRRRAARCRAHAATKLRHLCSGFGFPPRAQKHAPRRSGPWYHDAWARL